jgi:glycosyltransferase involved in cell wall biosynthesis
VSQPSVSVVVATRDRPQLLRKAVDSILGQRYDGPVEVIAVFDQSEPDRDLARTGTGRSVRVIANSRRPGLPGARNSGIAQSDRDLVAFCDDDDLWLPGKLDAQVALLQANPDMEVATTGLLVAYKGRVVPRVLERDRITFGELVRHRVMEAHPSSYLVWRSAMADIGPVDEDIPGGYAEDWDWLLRAARRADVGAVMLPLVKVFWHQSSYFTERWQMIADASDYLMAKYLELHDDPVGLANVLGLKSIALDALGRRTDGRDTARRALHLDRRCKRALVGLACSGPVLRPGQVMRVLQARGRGI